MKIWGCRHCKKEFDTPGEMIKHIIIEHNKTIVTLAPIAIFEKMAQILMDEFMDIWKTIIKKLK